MSANNVVAVASTYLSTPNTHILPLPMRCCCAPTNATRVPSSGAMTSVSSGKHLRQGCTGRAKLTVPSCCKTLVTVNPMAKARQLSKLLPTSKSQSHFSSLRCLSVQYHSDPPTLLVPSVERPSGWSLHDVGLHGGFLRACSAAQGTLTSPPRECFLSCEADYPWQKSNSLYMHVTRHIAVLDHFAAS
jgi:hypothetical protein